MSVTSRCYNCGLPGHQTQVCPHYGPRYPAPGKTAEDYAEVTDRVRKLIAADIINEHNADHSEDEDFHAVSEIRRAHRRRRTTGEGEAPQGDELPPGRAEGEGLRQES